MVLASVLRSPCWRPQRLRRQVSAGWVVWSSIDMCLRTPPLRRFRRQQSKHLEMLVGQAAAEIRRRALEESSWRTQDQNNTVLYKTDIQKLQRSSFSDNSGSGKSAGVKSSQVLQPGCPNANSKEPYLHGHTYTVLEEYLFTLLLYGFTVQM